MQKTVNLPRKRRTAKGTYSSPQTCYQNDLMYLVFVFLNMYPKRRFFQQMCGTQSAGISPAQKANRVTALTAKFVPAEVLHRQRCPKRRAV
jgi:hypothetical protein